MGRRADFQIPRQPLPPFLQGIWDSPPTLLSPKSFPSYLGLRKVRRIGLSTLAHFLSPQQSSPWRSA